jgi:hypothetical protein
MALFRFRNAVFIFMHHRRFHARITERDGQFQNHAAINRRFAFRQLNRGTAVMAHRKFEIVSSPATDGAVQSPGPHHHALGQTRELNFLSPPELLFPDRPVLQALYDLFVISFWAGFVSLFAAVVGTGICSVVVSLYYLFSFGE